MAGANSIFDGDKLLTTANNDRYLYFSSLSPDNDTDLGDSGVVVSIGIEFGMVHVCFGLSNHNTETSSSQFSPTKFASASPLNSRLLELHKGRSGFCILWQE